MVKERYNFPHSKLIKMILAPKKYLLFFCWNRCFSLLSLFRGRRRWQIPMTEERREDISFFLSFLLFAGEKWPPVDDFTCFEKEKKRSFQESLVAGGKDHRGRKRKTRKKRSCCRRKSWINCSPAKKPKSFVFLLGHFVALALRSSTLSEFLKWKEEYKGVE